MRISQLRFGYDSATIWHDARTFECSKKINMFICYYAKRCHTYKYVTTHYFVQARKKTLVNGAQCSVVHQLGVSLQLAMAIIIVSYRSIGNT
jgi:hypothetical protein